jgi:protease-4
MKTFFLSFLGGLAALLLFFVILPLVLIISFLPKEGPQTAAGAHVLQIDLRGVYPDQPVSSDFGAFFPQMSFVEMLLKLNAAVEDPQIKGVFIRASEVDIGSSRAEELREALLRLKGAGKFVMAHSQGFLVSGPSAYRAVSAADEIWIQPGASFEVPGVSLETLFFGDAFKKFNLTADIEQFYEYKNAPEVYKTGDFSPAYKEAMTALASSIWKNSVSDIATDRKIDPVRMKGILEGSPYGADQSLALGLVDKIGWPEDAADAARTRGDGEIVDIDNYHPDTGSTGDTVIALVGGEGDIVNGAGQAPDLLNLNAAQFASDTVAASLIALEDDPDVDAVVFRVDSGGGSATASDQVWRAVERLQEKGKKVVVSMGSAAASGGYYVAAGADAIVASRSTITGSIGVFGGKIAIADGLRMVGVNPSSIAVGGDYASLYSAEALSESQRTKLRAMLGETYDRFTQLVAEGRNIPVEKVREIARGRVWSGEDALALGLIDDTGDLVDAISKAKELVGVKPEDKVRLRMEFHRGSPFELFGDAFTSADAASRLPGAAAIVSLLGEARAKVLLQQMERASARGVQLTAPPIVEH